MSKQSKPPKFHHYVPKIYLKHWLNDSGVVYIYNKKTGKTSPSSIDGQYFGKNHLNTITYPDNTKGYWVETAFAELEGKIAPVLNKIATSSLSTSGDISYEDKLMLSMFVSAQFWRLPANTEFIKAEIENNGFSNMGLSATDRKSGRKLTDEEASSIYKHISSTDLFQKAYPVLMALLCTAQNSNYDNLQNWHFYFQHPGRHLTSDNPIMYTTIPTKNSIFRDFLLPVSSDVLLIATSRAFDAVGPSMSNALNILQVYRANQFVVGNNEGYLREIVDIYESKFKTIPLHDVENYVYREIFDADKGK